MDSCTLDLTELLQQYLAMPSADGQLGRREIRDKLAGLVGMKPVPSKIKGIEPTKGIAYTK